MVPAIWDIASDHNLAGMICLVCFFLTPIVCEFHASAVNIRRFDFYDKQGLRLQIHCNSVHDILMISRVPQSALSIHPEHNNTDALLYLATESVVIVIAGVNRLINSGKDWNPDRIESKIRFGPQCERKNMCVI